MIAPKKALEDFDALGLDEEALELFLAGNAARVFKLSHTHL
jgi:predicted TIM-barrel fold metal-dependent hydrolase